DEHVLDLLRPALESVARAPGSYLKPWPRRGNAPRAPADLAVERHRRVLQPDALVLAHGLDASAQVDPLRPDRRREQLGRCGAQRRAALERPEQVLVGGRMDPAEKRQDLLADQAADGVAVRRVLAKPEAVLLAVAAGLVGPEAEQRPEDTVLAL